jgi:predicted ATP-grasp superfamily ATP-dependent carboligase
MADRFVFPLMIKPVLSHEFTKLFHTKLFINDTLDLLRANFQGCLEAHQAVMISEIIPGTDYGTVERIHVYINSKGEVSAEFFTVKLRQTPPMYGVMRVGKSVPPIDDLREYSFRILSHLHYRGYANFEFKRDPRDGQLKLLEVNVRLPRQLALDIASGVDFPWMIYQDMMKDHQEVCTTYQEDTYVIELIADVADFIRFDPDHNLQRFFQPYLARRKVFSYLSLSDPGPFIRQIKIRSQRGIRRLLHLRTHRELRDGTNNE